MSEEVLMAQVAGKANDKQKRRFVALYSQFEKSTKAKLRKKIKASSARVAQLNAKKKKLESCLGVRSRYDWHHNDQLYYLRYDRTEAQEQKKECERQLKFLSARKIPFAKQYENILAIPRVKCVKIFRGGFVVYTDDLFGRDPQNIETNRPGPWRRIGAMSHTIKVVSTQRGLDSTCQWHNPEYHERGGHHAPQIGASGYPGCHGYEADKVKEKALRQIRIDMLVAMYVRFSECFGKGSENYGSAPIWPLVDRNEVPEWYLKHWRS